MINNRVKNETIYRTGKLRGIEVWIEDKKGDLTIEWIEFDQKETYKVQICVVPE